MSKRLIPASVFTLKSTAFQVALLVCSLTCACQSREAEESTAAPITSGSKATSVTSAVCNDYARSVCAKAGEDTPTCSAFETATALMPSRACEVGLGNIEHSIGRLAAARRPCEALMKDLCGAFGVESEMCDFVRVQTRLFPVEQCSTMQGRLPEVISDLKQLQAGKKTLSPDLKAAIAAGSGPGFGPPNAKVEIVEFSDFECAFCARAARVVQKIRELYPKDVRFVFRQFPLPMHANARLAAQASLGAHAQGRFWEFHDQLFANQGALDRAALERVAGAAGLNAELFKKSLDEASIVQAVESDMLLGKQVEVHGTPALFVNGRLVDHPTDVETVVNAIERALAQSERG
jgi:protein-disulfide isomerase